MISAAARAASGDEPPPALLRLAWECKAWNCLPEPGGYLDQSYVTMYRMVVLSNVYDACARALSLKGKEIHNLTDREREILKWLMDEGLWQL